MKRVTAYQRLLCCLLVACFLMVASEQAQAQALGNYVYTTVDCSGAVGATSVWGISNVGTVVGLYGASNTPMEAVRQPDGTYLCADLPSLPSGSIPYNMNDSGTIVGTTPSADGLSSVGFVLNGSTYTSFSHPSMNNTAGRGINAAGLVAGFAVNLDGSGNLIGSGVAFIYNPTTGVYTDIVVSGAAYVRAGAINTVGQVVGEYYPPTGGQIGYLYDPVAGLTYINITDFIGGKPHTNVRGINDAGLMAGWGLDEYSIGTSVPWVGNPVGNPSTGYVLTYPPTLDLNTGFAYLNGFNNSGQISGTVGTGGGFDGTGDGNVSDGFIGTPTQQTPTGINVAVNAGTVGPATVSLTFPTITNAGVTTVAQIDPSIAGTLPSGYQLSTSATSGTYLAFEVTTTAAYSTPIIIAFQVPPNVDTTNLQVFHYQGGALANVTVSCPGVPPQTICASVSSLSPFVLANAITQAQVQQPINADGSSVFNVHRGVVPVKFGIMYGGVATCQLPAATISLNRTSGTVTGSIDESTYLQASDSGSNYRVSGCQYVYNLATKSLGAGTYQVNISIGGAVAGSGTFALE